MVMSLLGRSLRGNGFSTWHGTSIALANGGLQVLLRDFGSGIVVMSGIALVPSPIFMSFTQSLPREPPFSISS